jgi:uncharacterized RDD family membrane protein YckC
MSSIEKQNPFTPPRADVEDVVVQPAGLVLAERSVRLGAWLLDSAPALIAVVSVGIAAALTMPFLFSRASAGYAPLIQADMTTDRDMSKAVAVLLMVFAVVFVAWGIYNIVLVYRQGQTWGKKVMGIRMVRVDGSRMSFARFFWLRGVVYGVCCLIPFIGWPIRLIDKLLIFRPSRQCLHDTIADTVVVTASSSAQATLAGARHA